MIRHSIVKLRNMKKLFLLNYYIAIKHYVLLISREIEFADKYLNLLPNLELSRIVVPDNSNDYEGRKLKVKKKYFNGIKGEYKKVHQLFAEKYRGVIQAFNLNL